MKIKWTKRANNQFQNQINWVAKELPDKYHDFIDAILDAAYRAAKDPYALQEIPEFKDYSRREMLVWHCRLKFQVFEVDDYIVITALYQQRQNFSPENFWWSA